MDELIRARSDLYDSYPANLNLPAHQHILDSYARHLKEKEGNLFCSPDKAVVHFSQFNHGDPGFVDKRVCKLVELREQLRIGSCPARLDPTCRFIFLHAPSSRERLNISSEMFQSLMTYYQVMPSFLDFIFSFGRHQHSPEIHFGGFRHESCLTDSSRGLKAPEPGRSGCRIQLCYILRTAEIPRHHQQQQQWSLRQTAAYHSLDLENGQSTWIVVKGDQLMQERLTSVTKSPHLKDLRNFGTLQDTLLSALGTHLVLCDWSAENWRWYINFLEKQVQATTRSTVDVSVSKPLDPVSAVSPFSESLQSFFPNKQRSRTFTFGRGNSSMQQKAPLPTSAARNIPPGPPGPPEPPERPPEPIEEKEDGHEGFTFGDLQRIQVIEEQANEALLVLRTNSNVLTEMRGYYGSFMHSNDCPLDIQQHCQDGYARFESRIASILHDLQMQQSRVESLLRLLADRKSLLYGILQFRSMEASKMLAERAQQSAAKTEVMTEKMHEIGLKTKQETVSMRIITLVTLFFLPGTFISTLMSTDIVRFQSTDSANPRKVFCLGALRLFCFITTPLMVATFLTWGVLYWMTAGREKRRAGVGHGV